MTVQKYFGWSDPQATNEQRLKLELDAFDMVSSGEVEVFRDFSMISNEPDVLFGDEDGESFRFWELAEKHVGRDRYRRDFFRRQLLGDCVGAAAGEVLQYLQCKEIAIDGDHERYHPISRMWLYGAGRVYVGGNRINGDGSLGTWQIEAAKKFGVVRRDLAGFPDYTTANGRAFGSNRGRVLDKWKDEGAEHLIGYSYVIKNFDQLATAIIDKKMPVTIASNQGFQMKTRKDEREGCSWFIPSGTWAHQMHIIGAKRNGKARAFINNQWGINTHGEQLDGPNSGGWVTADFFDRWCRSAFCVAYGSFDGYEPDRPDFSMVTK